MDFDFNAARQHFRADIDTILLASDETRAAMALRRASTDTQISIISQRSLIPTEAASRASNISSMLQSPPNMERPHDHVARYLSNLALRPPRQNIVGFSPPLYSKYPEYPLPSYEALLDHNRQQTMPFANRPDTENIRSHSLSLPHRWFTRTITNILTRFSQRIFSRSTRPDEPSLLATENRALRTVDRLNRNSRNDHAFWSLLESPNINPQFRSTALLNQLPPDFDLRLEQPWPPPPYELH
jgi:hypothetical protein